MTRYLALLLIWPSFSLAGQPIGESQIVRNQVTGDLAGVARALANADPVHAEERISTGLDSAARLLLKDDSSVQLGPNAELLLDRFVYDEVDADEMVLNSTRGVMRFISGAMTDKAVEIRTPTATIGIRGTQILTRVDGAGATDLLVEAGSVDFTSEGVTVQLNEGEYSRAEPGQPPTAPESASNIMQNAAGAMDLIGAGFDSALSGDLCPC